MDDKTLILMVVPLLVIQVGLQLFALYDIYQHKKVRPPLPIWVWALLVIVLNLLGPILYFVLGRSEDEA
jgi:hypothetical protein